MTGLIRRLVAAGAGAAGARAALAGIRSVPRAAELDRVNFRGRPVTLAGGPALAVAASGAAALGAASPPVAAAALVAGLGSGAVGLYDDVVGARPEQRAAKGFRGHLSALRGGMVTSGLIKIIGVGAASLTASALLAADRTATNRTAASLTATARSAGSRGNGSRGTGSRTAGSRSTGSRGAASARARRKSSRRAAEPGLAGTIVDVLLGAGVIAGTANLVNLLDLRPGRALKASLALGAPLAARPGGGLVAGPLGAAGALLRDDLGENIMLGDAGANALGALLGVGIAAGTGRAGRAAALAALAALTAASERVSFTKVIESTPGLRELDQLGRLPANPASPQADQRRPHQLRADHPWAEQSQAGKPRPEEVRPEDARTEQARDGIDQGGNGGAPAGHRPGRHPA
jgi:hypothetical protein